MLRSLKSLRGYAIRASDGDIGSVQDFYFDDALWLLRYMVVDTGKWLPGRKVLLSPVSAGRPEWEKREIPVDLKRRQVEESPATDTDKPISQQLEERLATHYGWPLVPEAPFPISEAGLAVPVEPEPEALGTDSEVLPETQGDPHLRSLREVLGYSLEATDGIIGHADDFVVDDESWTIRYLVADTGEWLASKKVLLSPDWVRSISWTESRVAVDLSRESVRQSPPFDPNLPVNREYEVRLYDYYGRPAYWQKVPR